MATATAANPATETIQEYATSQGAKLGVDREKGIIHGVKILGLESKNGRSYLPAAVAKAMPLYEHAKVNVNHVKPGETASYHDRMGRLKNVHAGVDGLYADYHFNPKHALAEQLCWDAENAPENVGFSHDVQAKTVRRDGKVVIEDISRVDSVDLVANPATTRGLYEDEHIVLNADPALRQLSEGSLSAMTDCRTIIFNPDLSIQNKKSRLLEVLATWQKELDTAGTVKETHNMEIKDLTVEQLKEHRQDLVAVLQGTDATSTLSAELKTVKESLDKTTAELTTLKAKEAELVKEKTISEELKAAKLDASDKMACSESFLSQLKIAPDADGRKRIIEDRVAILRRTPSSTIASAAPLGAVGVTEGAAGSGPGATVQETISRLTA
jgi:hypothetical protein